MAHSRDAKFLLVGETGSGKSTLINTLANFFAGGNLDSLPTSLKAVIPTAPHVSKLIPKRTLHSERDIGNAGASKTSAVTKYTFGDCIFLDTPGFADTAGPKKDDEHVIRILSAATNERELTGIIMVFNGKQPRATSNVQTVLSRLSGNIPDVARNNIVFVVTNCSTASQASLDLNLIPFTPKAVFYTDNSAFSTDHTTWTPFARARIRSDWDNSLEAIQQLVEFGKGLRSFPTDVFGRMMTFRRTLSSALETGIAQIASLAAKQEALADKEAEVARYQRTMNDNRSYSRSVTVYNTKTRVSSCTRTCGRCGGQGRFVSTVMVLTPFGFLPGQVVEPCSWCCGRGNVETEVTSSYQEPSTEEKIDEDMKRLFTNAEYNRDQCQRVLAQIRQEKDNLSAQIAGIAETVRSKCVEIKRVCSRFSLKNECEALVLQLSTGASSITNFEDRRMVTNLVNNLRRLDANL